MQKKLYLIANPCSGTGKIKNYLFPIVQTFSQGGYDVTVHLTSCRGDATVQASKLGSEYEMIVCCGGDGTLNEVITGLMDNPNTFNLGYIPAGTLNEWSSGLNISRNMKKAAEDILKNNIVPLDIGKFSDKYFSYTASFGAFTDASYATPQGIKNALGKIAYLLEGVKSLSHIHRIHLKLDCDGNEIEDDFIFGTVSNSFSVGGVVHYKKTMVDLSDGLFEVLLIRYPKNLLELNGVVSALLKKKFDHKGIFYTQAKKVVISEAREVDWTLDGEHVLPMETITVENLHSAINFVVPPEKEKKNKKEAKEEIKGE